MPSKYPGKKYFKGPKVGQLSGNPLGKNPSDVWAIPNVKNNHPEADMLLSDLIETLEQLLDQNGDLVVEFDSGEPVEEADLCFAEEPYTTPTSIVIK